MTEGNRAIKPNNTGVEIISVHVPKTAGTTFKKVLHQVYSEETIFLDYPHRGPQRNRMLKREKPNIKVIHGHFPGNKYDLKFPEAKKIIWLRNPIERLISHYFFWKSWQVLMSSDLGGSSDFDLLAQGEENSQGKEEGLTIVEFAEKTEMRNVLAANFLKNQRLTDFYFVGIQEFFKEDLALLTKSLNWQPYNFEFKNRNPYPEYDELLKEIRENREIIEQITEINREDVEIYREALSLRERRLNKSSNLSLFWENREVQKRKKRPTIEPLISWGFIDKATVENKILSLTGWAASRQGGPLEGFKVMVGDREYTFFEKLLGIPSPDVHKVHPTLDNASEARFRLRILIDRQQIEELGRSLIALTPLFSGGEGIISFKVFSPILPPPNREHLKIVGINYSDELTRSSFKLTGHLVQRVGLLPSDRILELGCNIGLTASSLVYYLKPTGSYEGFDFAEGPISWARQQITAKKPNFRFFWENVRHPLYNPKGTVSPADFIFPYPENYFDCVCIPHLFTHLQPLAVRHYLKQIAKVLKPGGRCLFSCFLLNSESQKLIAEGASSQNLIYELEDCFSSDDRVPEMAIGFREPLLLKWIEEAGFTILQKSYGSWCGRVSFSGADLLVLEKNVRSD